MSALNNVLFESAQQTAVLGRSFVLGLPDRHGLFRVGLERNVWKIPAGGYETGDRVRVIRIEDDVLEVEKVSA